MCRPVCRSDARTWTDASARTGRFTLHRLPCGMRCTNAFSRLTSGCMTLFVGLRAKQKWGRAMRSLCFGALLLVASPVRAQFIDGTELHRLSIAWQAGIDKAPGRNDPDTVDARNQYYGYVLGVYDFLEAENILCSPRNVKFGQAAAIVGKYLQANPEHWNLPGATLVGKALITQWPCKPVSAGK